MDRWFKNLFLVFLAAVFIIGAVNPAVYAGARDIDYSEASAENPSPVYSVAAQPGDYWAIHNTNWYYYHNGVLLQDDWLFWESNWYYLGAGGAMLEFEWTLWNGVWYYLGFNGVMAEEEWVPDNQYWYYLDSGGAMAQDKWIYWMNGWYYVKDGGKMAENEWIIDKNDGGSYYLGASGLMASEGTIVIGGVIYKFNASGRLIEVEHPTEPPTSPDLLVELSSFANEVFNLVNAERAKYGLKLCNSNAALSKAAMIRAKEITISFSHTRPDGRSWSTAYAEAGVSYYSAAENIAYGYSTPQSVMIAWMNSEGHRKNILSPYLGTLGVAVVRKTNGSIYWVQSFKD